MKSQSQPQKATAVHPHVCGEHDGERGTGNTACGSSPRVWGTSQRQKWLMTFPRFIPTCVGNIIIVVVWSAVITVHPHVCGEHKSTVPPSASLPGSSPRVWGTFVWNVGNDKLRRFIPTCVGNIQKYARQISQLPVHPHVCGEHRRDCTTPVFTTGSSPRVWGT